MAGAYVAEAGSRWRAPRRRPGQPTACCASFIAETPSIRAWCICVHINRPSFSPPPRAAPTAGGGDRAGWCSLEVGRADRGLVLARQRRAANVVIDVDVVVISPCNTGDSTPDRRRVLSNMGWNSSLQPNARHTDEPDQLLRWLEQRQATHMHGVFTRFNEKKHRVVKHHQIHAPITPITE